MTRFQSPPAAKSSGGFLENPYPNQCNGREPKQSHGPMHFLTDPLQSILICRLFIFHFTNFMEDFYSMQCILIKQTNLSDFLGVPFINLTILILQFHAHIFYIYNCIYTECKNNPVVFFLLTMIIKNLSIVCIRLNVFFNAAFGYFTMNDETCDSTFNSV